MAKHAKTEEEEIIEIEFDEESVSYYIVDEDDKEIGVCLIEDGEEVEYMYEESVDLENAKSQLEVVRADLSKFSNDTMVAAQELKKTTTELQKAYDEIMSSLKFFGKKK